MTLTSKLKEGKVPAMSYTSGSVYKCSICGDGLKFSRKYLSPVGENFLRDVAYLLPTWALKILALPSTKWKGNINSVITNKKFFGEKTLHWCDNCRTGFALPYFKEAELASYYNEFYWSAREHNGPYFSDADAFPSNFRCDWVRSQLDWVASHGVDFSSAIDFGAGDCVGAYLMSEKCGPKNVCVVDSSIQARSVAGSIGVQWFESLESAPCVDFLYASHSIEHTHDISHAFELLENKVCDGGHVFLETPNVAERQVFEGGVPTPHTFMLSRASFEGLSKFNRLKLIAADEVGPAWSKHHRIASQARTDLRVIFKKVSTSAAVGSQS